MVAGNSSVSHGIFDIRGEWRSERENQDSGSSERRQKLLFWGIWRGRIISVSIFHSFYLAVFLKKFNVFLSFHLQDSLSITLPFYRTSPKYFKQIRIHPVLMSWSHELFFSLSHSSVLTVPINFLIYNLSPPAIDNLILSIGSRGNILVQEWRALLPNILSSEANYSNVFLETLWELCILSWTVDFLDLKRT